MRYPKFVMMPIAYYKAKNRGFSHTAIILGPFEMWDGSTRQRSQGTHK